MEFKIHNELKEAIEQHPEIVDLIENMISMDCIFFSVPIILIELSYRFSNEMIFVDF